jgi:uncharacterized protein YndB with AHSA1/START domain
MTNRQATSVVFEKPDHDFPRRVIYERQEPAPHPVLVARVEGSRGGKPRKETWSFTQGTTRELGRIEKSVLVPASPEDIYRAFTTLEGVKTFFAPQARVEARPGGAYEMYFAPDQPVGLRGGEGCSFVELVPGERLAFTWNFPPSLPLLRNAHTLVTVSLASAGEGLTRVSLTQTGWRAGHDWPKGRAYFERAWQVVLDRLAKRFSHGPVDWSAP